LSVKRTGLDEPIPEYLWYALVLHAEKIAKKIVPN
jgi:hypothetical protein